MRHAAAIALAAAALLAVAVEPALAAPKPRLGRTVVVKPAGGSVLVKPRGRPRFSLVKATAIPVRSTVDTTHGRVRLISARGSKHTQSGLFSQGAFVVTQRRSDGLTDLKLTGGNFKACSAARAAGHRLTGAASRRRRLFGHAHGRFRTRGRNSSATVRGTQWLTEDRCDGTVTFDKQGSVATQQRELAFTLKPGQTIHYFCNHLDLAPDTYCVVLLSQPDDGLVAGGLLTRIEATQYDVDVKWPSGNQVLTFPLSPPNANGFRQSAFVCPVLHPDTYTFTWVLNGAPLFPPLTETFPKAAQPLGCVHNP